VICEVFFNLICDKLTDDLKPRRGLTSYGIGTDVALLVRIMAMRYGVIVASVASLIALAGCAGMDRQQQRALSGGAIGAAGGAVLGAVAGFNPLVGAAVGGAGGAAVGALTK